MTQHILTTPLSHARFDKLVSYQSQHASNGIPREVMEHLAANKVFPIISPPGLVGRNAQAAMRSWPGLCMTIAQCTPNQGPVSHNHVSTLETFFCLDGEFEILWGNDLQNKITLVPGDLCSVPPNVYRAFRNLAKGEARLLVMIQGDKNMSDKLEMPRKTGAAIQERHGDRVMELLAAINMRFQGDDALEPSSEYMTRRILRAGTAEAVPWNGELVVPVLSPSSHKLNGSVECWPGMTVVRLDLQPGRTSQGEVQPETCQWLVNIGDAACEVRTHDQSQLLERYGTLKVEPLASRAITNVGSTEARLLIVTQSRRVATLEEIQAFNGADA